MTRRTTAVVSFAIIAVITSCCCRDASSFAPLLTTTTTTITKSTPIPLLLPTSCPPIHDGHFCDRRIILKSTVLHAKQASNKKKNTANVAGGGSGGGFGTKTVTTDNQVRLVSGHRGSGEKPLRQAANTFDAIRKENGAECTKDVYCKSPLNDKETLWFVGKIAVRPNTAATPEQAILSQKRLILEYAKRELRPQNLGGNKYSANLELWIAPGDSEMDAVQNKISLVRVEGSTSDLLPDFSVKDVGYNPEIYVGDEREKGGLRIKRDEEGNPVKPVFDVNQSL